MAIYYVMNDGRGQKISNEYVRLDDLSDDECYQATRFPRVAVQELCDLLGQDLEHPTYRSHAIPADAQLIAALQLFASGSFQWMIGRSCRMSQASVSLAIDAVTKALVKRAPEFIKFPTDPRTTVSNKLAFHAVGGFSNVLGAIDCTHVAIKSPVVNEEAFVNRKGVHTVNIQGVCNMDMMFLDIVAKWPGSSHDAFIWRTSSLRGMFEQGYMPDGWLIGEQITVYQ